MSFQQHSTNSSIRSGASTGLQCLAFLVIAGCIATSMSQLNIMLMEIFKPGAFRTMVIVGMSCSLIASQVTMALGVQALRAKMPWYVIAIALANILFSEGMSITSSQLSFNNNMISATATQSGDSEQADQIRKSLKRSENRVAGFDATLAASGAENMTNRGEVLTSIEVEERKIRNYRRELNDLDESAASKAFSELPMGLTRSDLALTWAASLSISPATLSILLGALAWGGASGAASNVTPIKHKKAKGEATIGKKFKAAVRELAA